MILVNYSCLITKPTGISIYALKLLPYLKQLDPILLVGKSIPDFQCQLVANTMNADFGARGHWQRLHWTQWKLPKIYQSLTASLLFSPVPEAPLFTKCRSVVMVHDFIPLRFPNWSSPLTYYHRFYVPLVLQNAIHILCNSRATAADIVNFCQIPSHKITPIPLAFDREQFQFLDLPTANYFLYLGRQDPHKNLARLIQAFQQLEKDYELWIVGGSDRRYTPELEVMVKELELTDRVKFLGYIPHDKLVTVINQAIGLVFPSLWEGFGLPVLEAMACGTPVITSNVSALPETAGEAALLVDPYNIDDIADKMKQLARSDALRNHLRSLGLKHCQSFSWQKTGQQTAHVLANYLDR